VYDQQVGPTRTVSVYDLVGNVRFRVSGELFDLQVGRRTAYSLVPAGKTWRIDVLDAGSGRLLHRVHQVSDFMLIAG
jgi:hypothetical protein